MILLNVILGAVITAGAVGIVAAFWNDIVNFLQAAVRKVQAMIDGVLYGCKVFLRKMGEAIKEIARHYSKVDGHWVETTTTRTVPASEVPPDILKKAGESQEYDITDELEMELVK